jgi:hypothetical protein
MTRLAGDGSEPYLELVNEERQEQVIRPRTQPVGQSPEAEWGRIGGFQAGHLPMKGLP